MRGDKEIPYGRVMEVMSAIHAGGFSKVALLTEPFGGGPATGNGETDKKGS